MDIPQPTTQYKLHSLPVRIRYTGTHALTNFQATAQDTDSHITYIRGRKLIGQQLSPSLGSAMVITKEFDQLVNLGECKQSVWYEREGVKSEACDKISEMVSVAELIHGD